MLGKQLHKETKDKESFLSQFTEIYRYPSWSKCKGNTHCKQIPDEHWYLSKKVYFSP